MRTNMQGDRKPRKQLCLKISANGPGDVSERRRDLKELTRALALRIMGT